MGVTRAEFVRWAGLAGGTALLAPGRLLDAAAAAPIAGVHVFQTHPHLLPPLLTRTHYDPRVSAGYFFMAPLSGPGNRGPVIYDHEGDVIWSHNTKPVVALNFRPAIYKGKPVLTWWEGKTEHGLGDGKHVIVDQSYRVVKLVPTPNHRHSDLHEFILTPHGTALISAWEIVPMNLTQWGGPSNGRVIGGIVQEIDLETGRLLFEWRSLDHIALDESHQDIPSDAGWDYFHINSVELCADGNLMVSARNTWGVYKIDRGSGEVIWRLGGKKSDFTMGPGTVFAWQHDARHHDAADTVISIFNDGAAPAVQRQSKALVLKLDLKRKHASLLRAYAHTPPVLAHALGSTQLLPNGNVLVNWGTSPWITEYSRGGDVLFDAHLPKLGQNYRTLKGVWHGRPSVPPAAVHGHLDGKRVLWASWNGSTELRSWRLESGPAHGQLSAGGAVRRTGFETALRMPDGHRYGRAIALDAHGKPLGHSAVVKV